MHAYEVVLSIICGEGQLCMSGIELNRNRLGRVFPTKAIETAIYAGHYFGFSSAGTSRTPGRIVTVVLNFL
jgi:hypothetical protein